MSYLSMFRIALLASSLFFGVHGAGSRAAETDLPVAPVASTEARALVVHHPDATAAFTPQPGPIRKMVREGLLRFTAQPDITAAWMSLVSTQDVIGIKVHSAPGRMSGTRPAVVAALLETLIEAGVPSSRIIVWDRRLVDLRLAGYSEVAEKYGVQLAGAMDAGYDEKILYSTPLLGKLVYGDLEFGSKADGAGRSSHVTKLLTDRITRVINVAPLLNHNVAGVSGTLYSLAMGSVDNTLRFEGINSMAVAIPEIYALPELADRVVLNVVDALICQYQGEERSYLHYSVPLNELWFGKDAVAMDLLALRQMDRVDSAPASQERRKRARQIYENAGIMELGVADGGRIHVERLELK